MMHLLQVTSLLLFLVLAIMTGYLLLFSVAGKLGWLRKAAVAKPITKFVVLIPAYKEDAIILHTAKDALRQKYPRQLYDVVVIADSLKKQTIEQLRALPIQVVEVKFEQSTKAKSLNRALQELPDVYDAAIVLDADNLMAPDFLQLLNNEVQQGAIAIQGHRTAKNLNTSFAILDALSEEINNHIFRKGHQVLGLSSALIGSGMAFSYGFFKEIMAGINAVGGFDKEMEIKLLRSGVKISYVEDALIYDEKVQKPDVFNKQRRRWLSAQVHYLRSYFISGLYHLLLKGNIDYFNKVFQMLQLPRVLLSGLVAITAGLAAGSYFIFGIVCWPGINAWLGLLVVNIVAMLLAVPGRFYNLDTLKSLLQLPQAFYLLFLTLFRLKGANQHFIHTPHSSVELQNNIPR